MAAHYDLKHRNPPGKAGFLIKYRSTKIFCREQAWAYPCLMSNSGLFWELFARTARGAPMIVSSNWAAYLISGIIFLFNSTWRFFDIKLPWRERARKVWKSKRKDIFRGAVLLVLFWVILFFFSFSNVLKEDRAALNSFRNDNQQLKVSAKDLQGQLDNNCKEDKQNVQQAKKEAQVERDDARHWREAYEGTTRGDLHPDRHLDSEDQRRLREQLRIIAKEPRNRDYIKLDVGMSAQIEPSHLGSQLYYIFRDEHWNVSKPKLDVPKEIQAEMQAYGGPNYAQGIFIFSDDPQRGRYLSLILNDCCRLDAIVNPRGTPQNFKGTLLWVGVKQYQIYRDSNH
jgi:hypothetical protein